MSQPRPKANAGRARDAEWRATGAVEEIAWLLRNPDKILRGVTFGQVGQELREELAAMADRLPRHTGPKAIYAAAAAKRTFNEARDLLIASLSAQHGTDHFHRFFDGRMYCCQAISDNDIRCPGGLEPSD